MRVRGFNGSLSAAPIRQLMSVCSFALSCSVSSDVALLSCCCCCSVSDNPGTECIRTFQGLVIVFNMLSAPTGSFIRKLVHYCSCTSTSAKFSYDNNESSLEPCRQTCHNIRNVESRALFNNASMIQLSLQQSVVSVRQAIILRISFASSSLLVALCQPLPGSRATARLREIRYAMTRTRSSKTFDSWSVNNHGRDQVLATTGRTGRVFSLTF